MVTLDDRDDFENAYLSFLRTLRVLAAQPDQACELQGHYNVAFETAFEAQAFLDIFNLPARTLTSEHRIAVEEILRLPLRVPSEVLAFTDVAQESLERMRHPSWEASRSKAQLLVDELAPITSLNSWYFEQDRSSWEEPTGRFGP